jgi:hypothetical protein
VRIDLRREFDQTPCLKSIQGQYFDGIAHETVGLSDIVRNCTHWPKTIHKYTSFVQYQNVSEYVELNIPGVVEGLRNRYYLDVPLVYGYLEFFAVPLENTSTLRIRVIAGQGYKAPSLENILQRILDILSSSKYQYKSDVVF